MTTLLHERLRRHDGRRGHRARRRLGADRGRLRGPAVGGGEPAEADERIDLGGALVTPGLVNTHHHLYQTLTRARAQEADLFTWLKTLYPVWAAHRRRGGVRRRAHRPRRAGALRLHDRLRPPLRLPAAARTGLLEAEVQAARRARRHARRRRAARWTSASPTAACRPTRSSRTLDDDPGRRPRRLATDGGVGQIAVAPCSPFSVTKELMRESAELARRLGLPLHTHLAETVEEEEYCRELYGCTPGRVPRASSAGSRTTSGARTASTSPTTTMRRVRGRGDVGVAHCPTSNLRLGAGVAPVRELVDAGVRVGLGVDGSASNERSDLFFEVKQALLVARGRGGPDGDDRARGAAARHARRRGSARPRRHRLARAAASAPTSPSGARTGSSSAAPTIPVAGLVFSGATSRRPAVRRRRGGRPRRPARQRRRGRDRAGTSASRREDSRRDASRSPPTCSTPAAASRRAASASSCCAATRSSRAGRDRRRRPDRRARRRGSSPGDYRLVFHPPSPFFRRVELEVALDDGHYHVPLLVSPFGCASYRGS